MRASGSARVPNARRGGIDARSWSAASPVM